MPECVICSGQGRLQYVCNYCGRRHCSDHRLPENHDCLGIVVRRHIHTGWFDGGSVSDLSDDMLANLGRDLEGKVAGDEFTDAVERAKHVIEELGISEAQIEVEEFVKIGDTTDKPYTAYEPDYTVGTSVDPDYESSPDVNADGSIKGREETSDQELHESNGGFAVKPEYLLYILVVISVVYVGLQI